MGTFGKMSHDDRNVTELLGHFDLYINGIHGFEPQNNGHDTGADQTTRFTLPVWAPAQAASYGNPSPLSANLGINGNSLQYRSNSNSNPATASNR